MTSKEALDNLRFDVSISQDIDYKEANNECDIIKKDLDRLEKLEKAIEILKDCIYLPLEDDIDYVDRKGRNFYEIRYSRRLISEQEYNLLIEVLEDEK